VSRPRTSPEWTNWARTERTTPERFERPSDVESLVRVVTGAGASPVRVVGAGHSFTGAAATDGVLVSLDAIDDVERVRTRPDGTAHVTVGAGIRLGALNRALALHGLAMRNLGDIDRQSVAGAISTGTHGTGARLGGLATQVVGLRVVTAAGEVLDVDADHHGDLFQAARLGLGAVGLIAAVTLEAVPAFSLEAVEEPWPLDRVLDELEGPGGLVESNDHVEFYWFPHTRRALTKRNNRVDPQVPGAAPALGRVRGWVDDELLSNTVFEATNRLTAAVRGMTPMVNQVAARALSARRFTAPSFEVFVTPRRVRFREMEYAIPRAALVDVLAEIDRWIERTREHVPFPVEVRFAAADDVWLSTAHARESAYVAVHQYIRLPYRRYFSAVERIMAEVDGRPHWGKLHWLDTERLASLYPRFDDFLAVRSAQDPTGRFSNPYTDRVFGQRR